MHERTARLVCRAVFLGVCVLPTLGVLAWISWHHWPGRVTAHAEWLSYRLGMQVSLASVRSPRPGVTVYENLRLAELEFGTPLAEIGTVKAVAHDGQWTLSASEVQLENAGYRSTRQVIERLLCRNISSKIRCFVDKVSCRTPGVIPALTGVQLQIEPAENPRASLTYRLLGQEMPEPGRLILVRNRQTTPPSTGWELDTANTSLPGLLVSAWAGSTWTVGDGSRFVGKMRGTQALDGRWSAELTGQWRDLSLPQTLLAWLPGQLSGKGQLFIKRAAFRDGVLTELLASVVAGPGEIDSRLIAAAVDHLGLVSNVQVPSGRQAYEQLAVNVRLDSRGFTILGNCHGPVPGVVLATARGPMLAQPKRPTQPMTNLAGLLAPAGAALVPATPMAARLLQVLPLNANLNPPKIADRPTAIQR